MITKETEKSSSLYHRNRQILRTEPVSGHVKDRHGFDSRSGQTKNNKFSAHNFYTWCLAIKGQCAAFTSMVDRKQQ